MNAATWIFGDPLAYHCCGCDQEFDAVDAITDYLPGEGELKICPTCGSEDIVDLHDAKDEENITEDV